MLISVLVCVASVRISSCVLRIVHNIRDELFAFLIAFHCHPSLQGQVELAVNLLLLLFHLPTQ